MILHVVDDQPVICEYLTEVLRELGHDATAFQSPLEYLEYFRSDWYRKPEAIFMDAFMPEMSGFDLMRLIQEVSPDKQFIFISGAASLGNRFTHRDQHLYLQKPFGVDAVESVLTKLKLKLAA